MKTPPTGQKAFQLPIFNLSKYFHRNLGAGLGVGQGVVVVFHTIAAGTGNGVQLVVGELPSEMPPRGPAGAVESVVGIVHLIDTEGRPQAPLVERAVVGHQGQSGDERLHLPPHVGERGGGVGVFVPQAVHLAAEPAVVVGLGVDERVECVGNHAAAHHHHSHAAHAAGVSVGGLEIYCCKGGHDF